MAFEFLDRVDRVLDLIGWPAPEEIPPGVSVFRWLDLEAVEAGDAGKIKRALFLGMCANGGRWIVAPSHYAQARGVKRRDAALELQRLCEIGLCVKAGNGQFHVIRTRYERLPDGVGEHADLG